MGESKAIWDMIDAGLVGDNVNLVVKNENCKVMQLYRLPEKAQPYFYKSQVEKIHGIRKLITEDLSKNYTQEELSRRFEISLTPMKQCFKSTYGQSIYKYLREYRKNRAAEMLLTEPGKKVTDIAAACGYENPGKFGQAFREQFGVAPLEYRRSNGRRS